MRRGQARWSGRRNGSASTPFGYLPGRCTPAHNAARRETQCTGALLVFVHLRASGWARVHRSVFTARGRSRPELLQQGARLDQVGKAETFLEGSVDRRKQVACLGKASLVAPEPREIARGAQLEQQRRLRSRDLQRARELTLCPGRITRAAQVQEDAIPRRRCSSASNQTSPVRAEMRSASSVWARAAFASPASRSPSESIASIWGVPRTTPARRSDVTALSMRPMPSATLPSSTASQPWKTRARTA